METIKELFVVKTKEGVYFLDNNCVPPHNYKIKLEEARLYAYKAIAEIEVRRLKNEGITAEVVPVQTEVTTQLSHRPDPKRINKLEVELKIANREIQQLRFKHKPTVKGAELEEELRELEAEHLRYIGECVARYDKLKKEKNEHIKELEGLIIADTDRIKDLKHKETLMLERRESNLELIANKDKAINALYEKLTAKQKEIDTFSTNATDSPFIHNELPPEQLSKETQFCETINSTPEELRLANLLVEKNLEINELEKELDNVRGHIKVQAPANTGLIEKAYNMRKEEKQNEFGRTTEDVVTSRVVEYKYKIDQNVFVIDDNRPKEVRVWKVNIEIGEDGTVIKYTVVGSRNSFYEDRVFPTFEALKDSIKLAE